MTHSESAAEHLAGLRFFEALAGHGDVRVVDIESGQVLTVGESPAVPFDESMRILKQVLEDVATVASWLGEDIPVPPEISAADANAVHHIARLIDGIDSRWTRMTFTLVKDPGEDQMADGGVLQVRRPLWIEIFGDTYAVGEEVSYVDGIRVARSDVIDGGRTYVLEPTSHDSKMLIRLERSKEPQPRTPPSSHVIDGAPRE